jgi:CDP-diacylglycerol--serine O-phosphatidyltransferase
MDIIRWVKLPDLITIVNALLGFTALLMATYGDIMCALILIFIAAVADGMDGIVARSIEHGVLGSELDSLADLISFGVAPAVIVFLFFACGASYFTYHLICAFSAAYLVCGMLRLVKYSLSASEMRPEFAGLPITASALCIASFVIIQQSFQFHDVFVIPLLGILSFLMISGISYPKITDRRILLPIGIVILFIITFYYVEPIVCTYAAAVLFSMLILYFISPLFRVDYV